MTPRRPMRAFTLTLRLLAVAFIAAAGLHFVLGLHADAMLGVPVTADMAANASFDSQNRFYGIAFSLLGVVLLIGATDLRRYKPMLAAVLGVLFLAGVGRALSWGLHGAPAPALIAITCVDLVLPPLLYAWLRSVSE
jgi:hypothetical protein